MGKNELDELLLKKLEEGTLAYDPESWERLSRLLPQEGRSLEGAVAIRAKVTRFKKWSVALGMVAGLALIAGSFWWFQASPEAPEVQQLTTTLAEQEGAPIAALPPEAQQGMPAPLAKAAVADGLSAGAPVGRPGPMASLLTIPDIVDDVPLRNDVDKGAIKGRVPEMPAPKDERSSIVAGGMREDNKKDPAPGTSIFDMEAGRPDATIENEAARRRIAGPVDLMAASKPVPENRAFIGIGGGMNYGSLNAGYALGITAKANIAGDFFIDGTVAMLYNNNATNTGINNGPSLNDNKPPVGNGKGGGGPLMAVAPNEVFANSVASPAMSVLEKLYYVQFNPSIGYEIDKSIMLSVGGDFQKMLSNENEIVVQKENKAQILPNLDIGLTAKSEIGVTSNITAGLLYREGLNHVFKSDGGRYLNRRYVQVQFKYNLPVR